MSHASSTLDDIIHTSFGGKKINLANASGLAPRVITKLSQNQNFTPATLAAVCAALPASDARRLCESVCRDIIPADLRDYLHITPNELGEPTTPYHTGPELDKLSEATLHRLRELCATEPETRAWLHRMGSWILDPSPETTRPK